MLKKSLVCATMLGIVCITLASSGGGRKKASGSNLAMVPIRANGTFTLKSKPSYSGSHILSSMNSKNSTVYRSVVTYQQGNTTYVVPSTYKVNTPRLNIKPTGLSFRSNLNMIDLKIRLCK